MGVRGLEQMVDNRMNHAPTLASVQATKKASSIFQSSWIRRVTRYCLSSAVVQQVLEDLNVALFYDTGHPRKGAPKAACVRDKIGA